MTSTPFQPGTLLDVHPPRSPRLRRASCIALGLLVLSGCAATTGGARDGQSTGAGGQSAEPGPTRPAALGDCGTPSNGAGPRVVDFGPGLRIDYRVPQVEVDGDVILRSGELELFAYSRAPIPKEHESIVLLAAPPSRIYQALGLIGLTPGKTTRYFYETQTTRLPTGDPVDVLVRYREGGEERTVSACAWMREAETGKALKQTYWLFTGSEIFGDGAFYADEEGTTVTVVDFPSSLLSLPDRHSESNDELWLLANTDAIPPLRTRVTVILRPHPTTLHVRVARDGGIVLAGPTADVGENAAHFADAAAALAELRHRTRGWADRATVELQAAPEVAPALIASLREALRGLGVAIAEHGADSAAATRPEVSPHP